MTKNRFVNLIFFAVATISCSSSGSEQKASRIPNENINSRWAENELWDDGKAEVAIYKAERVIYGKPRRFEYVYVLVKETFNEKFHVKTDDYDRRDLYAVMKVNKFCRIPTEAYPYHFLTSVFFKRDRPADMHKLTNTSQEWCGNTAKSFLKKDDGDDYTFDFISYWDGQGNGTEKIPNGPWFEDQLSYTLRTLKFQEDLNFTVELYPTQVTNKADIPKAETAEIVIAKAAMNELDSASTGFASDPWKIAVNRKEGPDLTFWINNEYPNYLLKMEASDGRKLSLQSLERDAYWAKE